MLVDADGPEPPLQAGEVLPHSQWRQVADGTQESSKIVRVDS